MKILVTRSATIALTDTQAQKVVENIQNPNVQFIQLGDQLIAKHTIEGVFSEGWVSVMGKTKRGLWICDHEVWHEKFKLCDCVRINYDDGKSTLYAKGVRATAEELANSKGGVLQINRAERLPESLPTMVDTDNRGRL